MASADRPTTNGRALLNLANSCKARSKGAQRVGLELGFADPSRGFKVA